MQKDRLSSLLSLIGAAEPPLGIYFTDKQPVSGISPRKKPGHDCMLKYVRIARKKHCPGWISRQMPTCGGASIYAGFTPPNDFVANYVSTGTPELPGERYLPSPDAMWSFFNELDRPDANGNYCVFKPLDLFEDGEEPEVVVFFVKGEMLSGLCGLAYFTFANSHAVAFPFGSGCSSLIAWPRHYAAQDEEKAVVGGTDPSCRPYLDVDELIFAVSGSGFKKMLDAMDKSFLQYQTWQKVLSKIQRSNSRR